MCSPCMPRHTSHPYSLLPRPVILESLRPGARKLYQSSLQCQLMSGKQRCPLFSYPWWQVVRIHQTWPCAPLLGCTVWTFRHDSTVLKQHHAATSAGRLLGSTTTVRAIAAYMVSRPSVCAAAHSYRWFTGPAGPGCCHHGFGHVDNDDYHSTSTTAY